jgi:3',5'-cyclic AMP phosphodiesterase CpdA
MRIAITSDLHFDPRGNFTSPATIQALVRHIREEDPDAVLIAGDLAHGLRNFKECLSCFQGFEVPVGVIAGNHDLWRDPASGSGSLDLWRRHLPQVAKEMGFIWLEAESIFLSDTAIVGSLVWYDYSAIDRGFELSRNQIAELKARLVNDSVWIDWTFGDPEFAESLLRGLQERIHVAAVRPEVSKIFVATHVPILEGQMPRKADPVWGLSNAYFGNLTAGDAVLTEPKIRVIASGHTHVGRTGIVDRSNAPPVQYFVVPSEYGTPECLFIEL